MTPTERKQHAQDLLLNGVANVLGYWQEMDAITAESMTEAERAEFRKTLQAQADRLAKLFGYERAWSN